MITVKPFEKEDWYGWGGATAFEDGTGSPPVIGSFEIGDVGEDGLPVEATLIVGDEAADVYWVSSDGEKSYYVRHVYDGRWTYQDALTLASRLRQIVSFHDLEILGFCSEITEC